MELFIARKIYDNRTFRLQAPTREEAEIQASYLLSEIVDPSPFQVLVMEHTGATHGEVHELPDKDFMDLVFQCIKERDR